jgi:hypothetical protein
MTTAASFFLPGEHKIKKQEYKRGSDACARSYSDRYKKSSKAVKEVFGSPQTDQSISFARQFK